MTPSQLRRIVNAYSREAGTVGLASALGVSDRTVRRWLAGTSEIPAWIERELPSILSRRALELRDLSANLRNDAAECERLAREMIPIDPALH